jgi:hypothetical protein
MIANPFSSDSEVVFTNSSSGRTFSVIQSAHAASSLMCVHILGFADGYLLGMRFDATETPLQMSILKASPRFFTMPEGGSLTVEHAVELKYTAFHVDAWRVRVFALPLLKDFRWHRVGESFSLRYGVECGSSHEVSGSSFTLSLQCSVAHPQLDDYFFLQIEGPDVFAYSVTQIETK